MQTPIFDTDLAKQWENVPNELKEIYTVTTEKLYSQGINREDIPQKEATIYNSIFGQYGLNKPVRN